MKAISLHEPWASLIAYGVKTIETRSWKPPESLIGQRIAIHAAKRKPKQWDLDIMQSLGRDELPDGYDFGRDGEPVPTLEIPLGKVLATAVLADAWQVEAVSTAFDVPGNPRRAWSRESKWAWLDDYGDFSPGRWLWFLKDVERLDPPIPAVGRQGFWNWENPNA